MIFRPELVKLILQGKKTMTRRPVDPSVFPGVPTKCRYQPTRTYALQAGRGKPASARITITSVRCEQLGDISLRDARREGFKTTSDFVDYWTALYGKHSPDQDVWVISFLLGDHTDQLRLLVARSGGPGGDYTTLPARAMRAEPEAIPANLQATYAKESAQMLTASRNGHLDIQLKRLQVVIAEIREHARDPSVNENLRGLERQAKNLERKLSQ